MKAKAEEALMVIIGALVSRRVACAEYLRGVENRDERELVGAVIDFLESLEEKLVEVINNER